MPSLEELSKKLGKISQPSDDEDDSDTSDESDVTDEPSDSEDDRQLASVAAPSQDVGSNLRQQDISELQKLKDLQSRASGQTPVDAKMNTSDAISKLVGNQDSKLKSALDAQNNLQLIAMLNHAGSTIGSAFTPLSHIKPDESSFNTLMQAANKPVQNLQFANSLQKQTLQDAVLEGQAKKQLAENDPNSQESISFRKSIMAAAPDLAKAFGSDFQNISASDKSRIWEPLKLKETLDARNLATQSKIEERADLREKKSSDKENQALAQTSQVLESARGNPEVAQALKDRYAASKALKLLDNKDPNNLSKQEVSLFVGELGKIATGGVPTVEEMKALSPSTLSGALRDVYSKVANSPTPANVGAFIKQYKTYLDDLNDNAQKVIKDKFGRVIETNKARLGKDNYNALQEQYLKPFVESDKAKQSSQFDSDVMDYAKKHNISADQAQAIKDSRTGDE